MSAGARVAAGVGRTVLDRKGPEAAQFDPVALGHGVGDFPEDRVDVVGPLGVCLLYEDDPCADFDLKVPLGFDGCAVLNTTNVL
jgi:hypothetical protein